MYYARYFEVGHGDETDILNSTFIIRRTSKVAKRTRQGTGLRRWFLTLPVGSPGDHRDYAFVHVCS